MDSTQACADPTTAHPLALGHIQDAILEGRLRTGDRLPSERALALEIGVSRGAVREAIRALQSYGILESHPGRGHGTRVVSMQSKALGRMFSLHLATSGHSEADLAETRIALERSTARLAAQHWDEESLGRLGQVVDLMDATHELEAFNELDTHFHKQVAVLAGNPLLRDLTVAIRDALRTPILHASLALDDWRPLRARLCREHRAIFEAIAASDADRASALVASHVRAASATLFEGQAR